MAQTTCTKLTKVMLVVTGICYLVCAAGLSYVGIWVFSTYDHFDGIADNTITLLPASIILGTGVLMCIIGFLALIAAFKSNKILLAVFFCLILVVFVGEVMATLLSFIYRTKLKEVLTEDMTNALNNYNITPYQDRVDYIQRHFECCGVVGASDWEQSTYWKQNHTGTVPTSCCNITVVINNTNIIEFCNATLDSGHIYLKGCLDEMNSEFARNLIYLANIAVFLAVIQFLVLLCACIMVCRTRGEHQYETLVQEINGGFRV